MAQRHRRGRWEGADRNRQSLEIDLVAHLAEGGLLTGAVKWNRTPIEAIVHWNHLDMLQRAADAGRTWAHQALKPEAPSSTWPPVGLPRISRRSSKPATILPRAGHSTIFTRPDGSARALIASLVYQDRLRQAGCTCSKSRKGNCWDTARPNDRSAVESFFSTLKLELVHERRYATRQQARAEIFEFIEL